METQKSAINIFANANGYEIIQSFGEKNESAKNEDGLEFNKMLSFAKNKRNNINIILVYKIDRFTRAGGSLIDELRDKNNILVIDVSSPTIIKNHCDVFMQRMKVNISRLENETRTKNIQIHIT